MVEIKFWRELFTNISKGRILGRIIVELRIKVEEIMKKYWSIIWRSNNVMFINNDVMGRHIRIRKDNSRIVKEVGEN